MEICPFLPNVNPEAFYFIVPTSEDFCNPSSDVIEFWGGAFIMNGMVKFDGSATFGNGPNYL